MITILKNLETELKLRGYTQITVNTYLKQNQRFLNFIKKTPEQISEQDIKNYIAYLISEKHQKPASVNLTLSALKFFYETILKKKIFTEIKPPKLEKKIPVALTKEEIKKFIQFIKNKKHRLLIELMYSSGLRVSEAVSIKLTNLDLDEKMGKVISGKGKKDRHIIISNSLIPRLKEYIEKRKTDSEYLFPSPSNSTKPISIRMAQKIVTSSAKKAGLKKKVFCHVLRSSFATHLLENGIDIRYIQVLLGHSNISTTERYTKVSTKQLKKIKSPLDDL